MRPSTPREAVGHAIESVETACVALEVATQGDAEGWHSVFKVPKEDRDLIREAIDRMGEVSEEDYYSFGIRFEVIEQIHLLFSARTGATGAN